MAPKLMVERFDNGMHFVMVDKKTVETIIKGGNKRAICRLNDQFEFHWAIMPKKEGGHFINIGLNICRKLKIKEGSIATATFIVDTTNYQFEMPEELREVLDTDIEASKVFHSLTKGNQRGLIYLVTQVKSSCKRIDRALKIAERIKSGVISPKIILK